jgi:trigger factor
MQITRENINPTSVKLTISADTKALDTIKKEIINRLGRDVKVAGFRPGKAPANVIEKNLDPNLLQSEFLNEAINNIFMQAIRSEKIRVVTEPQITIGKFVPFDTLEFTAEVEIIGEVKVGDYKKLQLAKPSVKVTAKDVDDVIENLRERSSEKQEVSRIAKLGDEAVINFKGVDAKTKEPISGADGKDYPLMLGSKSFIPGFEEEVVGLKVGDQKSFDITFPSDYGSAELQNRKVTFDMLVNKVNELHKPELNDAFASQSGPFKTIAELKADVKKQLQAEKEREADQKYNDDLLTKLAEASEVPVPKKLIDEEIDRLEEEEKRNLAYRGQTWQEHLDGEGVTAEVHHERQRPFAETRVKIGLVLGEVADKESITVSQPDLDARINLLKSQYEDPNMQAELDKPENKQDIYNRMLVEKTVDKLRSFSLKPITTAKKD